MKISKIIVTGLLVATTAVAINTGKAHAADATCKIEATTPVSVQDHGKNFIINESEGTVSATFTVTGDANCRKQAVLAVWVMPNATGQPLESQTFYDYASKANTSYGPGKYAIAARLPKCDYWQLDLLEGSDPKGIDGTANYGNLMQPISPDHTSQPGYRRNILDTQLGGKKKDCRPPKTDKCPNLKNMQKKVPAGYTRDKHGKCVQKPAPKELVHTGPTAVVGAFSGTTALGYVVSRLKNRFQK